jgi:hypothetical protein
MSAFLRFYAKWRYLRTPEQPILIDFVPLPVRSFNSTYTPAK